MLHHHCRLRWLWLLALLGTVGLAQAEPVEVTLMLRPQKPAFAQFQELAKRFNERNPDIHFRIIATDISEKMHLLTAAEALPDIVNVVDFHLVNYGRELMDLRPFFEADPTISLEDLHPQLVQAVTYDGQVKTLPIFYNVPLLYYRVDLFREAGLDPPSADWTWEDYRQAARRLTRRGPDGRVEIWGTSMTLHWWVEWLGLLRQAGSDLMTRDGIVQVGRPETNDALRLLHALVHEDQSAPPRGQEPSGGFMSGRYAMDYGGHVYNWQFLRRDVGFEWDVAPLPAGPAGSATGEFAVAGFGIWRKSRHPEAAWRVLSFLASREAGELLAVTALPPVRKDVTEEIFLAGTPQTRTIAPRNREAVIQTLSFARSVPKHEHFLPISQAVSRDFQRLVSDPDPSGLDTAHKQLEHSARAVLTSFGEPPSTPWWWVAIEVVVLAGLLLVGGRWLLRQQAAALADRPRRSTAHLFLFIAPWIVGAALLFLGPMLVSFFWSHTRYNIVDRLRFVGLSNYITLLCDDPDFWHSLLITVLYTACAVPLTLLVALAAALLLNRSSPGMGVFRTIFYLPSILPVAASGIMWAWFLNPTWGVFNQILGWLGIEGPGWLHDPQWALWSIVLISVWGFGGPMIIFLAGLKNIPPALYEAADIDGAGRIRQFFSITLPYLSPVTFFNLVMGIIGAVQIFDLAYVLGQAGPGPGGPERATYFYVLNLYERSFVHLQVGIGSAMAWVLFVLILVLTLINFRMRRYWVFSEERG